MFKLSIIKNVQFLEKTLNSLSLKLSLSGALFGKYLSLLISNEIRKSLMIILVDAIFINEGLSSLLGVGVGVSGDHSLLTLNVDINLESF